MLNIVFTFSGMHLSVSLPHCCCCSVAQLHVIFCDPMDCSIPHLPVLHNLPEFAQTHVNLVDDAIQPSHPLLPPSPPALSFFPGSFPMSRVLASWGQSIGALASKSVLPMNILS